MSGESPLSIMRSGRPGMPARRGAAAPRRPLWPAVAIVVIVVALSAVWCVLWYLAAGTADRTLSGWVEREAAAGRIYSCGSQRISGFPFRIAAHCVTAAATLTGAQPPVAVAAKELTFTAQVWRPTSLVGEITGPLTVAAPGQPPVFRATWSLARVTVAGVPPMPDEFAFQFAQPHLDRLAGAAATTLFAADNAAFDASIAGGAANDHPVIDAVLQLTSAIAPTLHPLLAAPLQGRIEIVLRGFKDLSPKPWAARFREMQAAGGNIEVKSLRIERSDAIVVGAGTLTVNAGGKLDGLLNITVSGLENIVPLLGIDRLIGQSIDRLGGSSGPTDKGLAALDRLVPGLSGVVRQGANAGIIDAVKKMGQPAAIDGKPATALPLRFADGAVYLGIIRLGEVPPLF